MEKVEMSETDMPNGPMTGVVDGVTGDFESNLYEADLSEADLSEADLSEADLSGADLSGADLSGISITIGNVTRSIA